MPYSDQFVNIYPKTTTKARKTTSLDKGYDYQNLYTKFDANPNTLNKRVEDHLPMDRLARRYQ